jgi:ubiquinone/menaquinone biosynthesis C-methylase UbiE
VTTATDTWTPRANPSEDYERYIIPAYFRQFAERLVTLAAPWPGERVLDVACGTGVVTRLIPERVGPSGYVTGLDMSPGMLAVARSVLDDPNVTWEEGNAVELPFAEDAFDVVTCQQGLQFFPERAKALREMRRVLRPGGRLALSVWRSIEYNPVFHLLSEALARLAGPDAGAMPPFSLGDRAELRRLVDEAGFTDVSVCIDGMIGRFPSPAEAVRRLVMAAPSMLGALAHLGPDANQQLVEEVTRTVAPYVDDAGLAVPLTTHVLLAR